MLFRSTESNFLQNLASVSASAESSARVFHFLAQRARERAFGGRKLSSYTMENVHLNQARLVVCVLELKPYQTMM